MAIESGDDDWAASTMRTHILTGRAISHDHETNPAVEAARASVSA